MTNFRNICCLPTMCAGFPGSLAVKAFARNVGDRGLIPRLGRSPGKGNGTPLQYSCLESPIDGGARWAAVHRIVKSRARLSDLTYDVCSVPGNHGQNPPCPSVAYPSQEGGDGNADSGISSLINAGVWEASWRPRRGGNPHARGLPEAWFFK